MDNKEFVNNFLKKLREQAAETEKKLTPEDLNKKIKNYVRSWWKNESKGYKGRLERRLGIHQENSPGLHRRRITGRWRRSLERVRGRI